MMAVMASIIPARPRCKLKWTLKLLLPLLLIISTQSQSLTISYSVETIKGNASKAGKLEGSKQLAHEVLKSKYNPPPSQQGTLFKNAGVSVFVNKHQPEYKYSNGESIKKKVKNWNTVVVGVITLTSSFAILMMTLSRFIERKIEETQDSFLKNAFNMCFKQIALIGVINLVLWLILQTRIAARLDAIIFRENLPNLKDDVRSIMEPIFECLLSVSVILLAWYIVYVIYFHFIVRRTIAWMRKADNTDVLSTAKELEFVEQNCCNALWNPGVIKKGKFLANRFEFIENVNNMNLHKVDPGGYYFMEYLRATILDVSVQMLRFPREVLVLVIVMSLILRGTFNFEGRNEVLLLSIFSVACAVAMIILGFYVFSIEKKLYPDPLSQYLFLKHNTDGMEISKYINHTVLPEYKLAKIEEEPNNFLTKLVHGDAPVNKHENLFIFKSKGPAMLLKLFEVICFTFLIVLSIWVYLVQQHQDTWLKIFKFGNPLVLTSLAVLSLFVPKILYSLIIVCKTGMLIELDTAEKVWESNRSSNTRHAMELIDALNLDSVETSLERNGDIHWRHLLAKLKTSPLAVQKQMADVWSSLDTKNKGVIGMAKVMRFMSSQGLQITNKKKMKNFIRSFTRTKDYTMTEEEFLVLGLVVKQIIIMPLDASQMKVLFEEVYGIPWTSPFGIDCESLQGIVKHLGLKWSEGDRRHLLDFLSGGRCEGMSAENFIEQLSTVEQLLKPSEHSSLSLEV